MRIYSTLLIFCALLLTACGGNTDDKMTDEETMEDRQAAETDIGTGNPGNENIELTPMPATKEFPNASIDDWKYDASTFKYTTSGYMFGMQTPDADAVMCANSAKGQHAHLIIDNEPYIAKYEPEFEQAIVDGDHHILTFLSRSYHESIKTPAAHRAVMATVAGGKFTSSKKITEPMLFYSRPKGEYKGKKETEKVMLDFYPVNAEIGGEYMVKADINGKEFMIDKWQPYYITGLPMGENTVTLTLMSGGNIVDTPLNPVVRTFTLEALPTEM